MMRIRSCVAHLSVKPLGNIENTPDSPRARYQKPALMDNQFFHVNIGFLRQVARVAAEVSDACEAHQVGSVHIRQPISFFYRPNTDKLAWSLASANSYNGVNEDLLFCSTSGATAVSRLYCLALRRTSTLS